MKRISIPSRFHAGIDNGKLVASEFVAFLVNECGAINFTGKNLNETALRDLTIDGLSITRCKIDTIKYQAYIWLG